jgi:hypothetical protein
LTSWSSAGEACLQNEPCSSLQCHLQCPFPLLFMLPGFQTPYSFLQPKFLTSWLAQGNALERPVWRHRLFLHPAHIQWTPPVPPHTGQYWWHSKKIPRWSHHRTYAGAQPGFVRPEFLFDFMGLIIKKEKRTK